MNKQLNRQQSNHDMRTAIISISQSALSHNLIQVKKRAPNTQVLAMVKANAYGHGVDLCLPALSQADAIGVATLAEAVECRKLKWQKPIVLIEGVFEKTEWQTAIDNQFYCVIHHKQQLDWALANRPNKKSITATIWLKINTGMNRLGFSPDEIIEVAKQLNNAGYHLILTSHFANADDKNHLLNIQQATQFSATLNKLHEQVNSQIQASLCNSAAIINFPNWHYDWIRPGIMLYGSTPVIDQTATQLNLKSAMTLTSKIIAIHNLEKGAMIGYGSHWIANKPSRIGIVSIGYGDGYPRVIDDSAWLAVHAESNNKYLSIDTMSDDIDVNNLNTVNTHSNSISTTHKVPIVGRVAMDMLVIDLTDLPSEQKDEITINSPVTLWGQSIAHSNDNALSNANDASSSITNTTNPTVPHIDEVAKSANTISYELLCRLTARPKRNTL